MKHTRTRAEYQPTPVPAREPCRSSSEVLKMFGFKHLSGLHSSIQRGNFPQPDLVTGLGGKVKLYWTISTLNKEMKRRKESTHHSIHKGEEHA